MRSTKNDDDAHIVPMILVVIGIFAFFIWLHVQIPDCRNMWSAEYDQCM